MRSILSCTAVPVTIIAAGASPNATILIGFPAPITGPAPG
jgi:hypothetical protein